MKNASITLTNSQGVELSGKLELPADQHPEAFALFAHCFTCSKNLTAVRNISRALTQKGFGVVRFDFTGLGQSGGDFVDTNFSSNIQDLMDVANYMAEHLEAPKLIIGHSLGGAAAIFAGTQIESIEAVATIGAPSSPDHVTHLFESSLEEIESEGKAMVSISGRSFPIAKQFIDDISGKNMSEVVKSLRKPLLILHSPHDTIVGINNAAEIYTAAMHPKSFISLNGADHLLSKKEDSMYAGNVIAEWASRYLETAEKRILHTDHQVVAHIGKSYTTEILAAGHPITADEPLEVGGNNFGPSPYDLLLSSLGACTAMTLRMYADRKGWELEEVKVHLNHKKDYAQDCIDCEKPSTKIDHITRKLELVGNLTDEQKQRLMEIADKCPVHKTLHNDVSISTSVV